MSNDSVQSITVAHVRLDTIQFHREASHAGIDTIPVLKSRSLVMFSRDLRENFNADSVGSLTLDGGSLLARAVDDKIPYRCGPGDRYGVSLLDVTIEGYLWLVSETRCEVGGLQVNHYLSFEELMEQQPSPPFPQPILRSLPKAK